ncbi:collagen triple helix repeat-containing protein 1-like [Xenia sp. Carnegie-2017]|uniref:collagen triple helix repeat-containing protein 1-like n=1 Tax=Xenia sp. Carnegie-2017 TaxID=2897299 RepID=UPI001F04CCEC|nr:collagen triple helix repeat-containing protein 1-like [Xenia sp. Carnegie-2017]
MVGYIFVTFLVIGACNATNKEFEIPQSAFMKINENGDALAPKNIIASHLVDSAIECSFECHREKRCVGFNYLDEAKKSEINCHISNTTTRSRVKTLFVKEKWTFYQALFKTGEKEDGQFTRKNITSNWKQCAWLEGNGLNNGLIKSCSFEKKCSNTYLNVFYAGNLRIQNCDYCCKRWYFKFNGKECNSTIEGVFYIWKGKGTRNVHRHRHIEGYCGNIDSGTVNVGFYVGNCQGYSDADAASGWNSISRIVIQEVPPPQT